MIFPSQKYEEARISPKIGSNKLGDIMRIILTLVKS